MGWLQTLLLANLRSSYGTVLGGVCVGNQCYRAASVIVALGLSLGCTKVVEDKTPAAAADADPASAELGRTLDTSKAISSNDAQ